MKRSKLKKRLRKKFHRGEFQQFGFEVEAKFRAGLSEPEFDGIYDEFIEEIEAEKLLFGGGGGPSNIQGFVTASGKYQSPTDAQREKIKQWFESRGEISECKVGKLFDAWYDVE